MQGKSRLNSPYLKPLDADKSILFSGGHMLGARMSLPLFLFCFSGAAVLMLSLLYVESDFTPKGTGKVNKTNYLYNVTNLDYYLVKNNKPQFYIKSVGATIDRYVKKRTFQFPDGHGWNSKGEKVYFKANFGEHFDKKDKKIVLKGKSQVRTKNSVIKAKECEISLNKNTFEAKGNVDSQHTTLETQDKLFITSDFAKAWHDQSVAIYRGNVSGKVERSRIYEPGVDFKTDMLSADFKTGHIELNGNVVLRKQQVRAQSLRGEIFLENYNKKLKYYALYDDVKIKEKVRLKTGGYVVREAFGEKLEGFHPLEKIVLTGSPKVIQGNDTIKGNVITLIQNNETVEVDDAASSFIIKN